MSIMANPDLAQKVFDKSVGGTKNCINNAMEHVNELAVMCSNYLVVKDIEEKKINTQQFAKIMQKNFCRDLLQTYIETTALPYLIKEYPGIEGTYEPEVGQSIKWGLKDNSPERNQKNRLDLPDTVTPSTADYPGKNSKYTGSDQASRNLTLHQHVERLARNHVVEEMIKPGALKAYMQTDPLWREGVIALARIPGEGRPKDMEQLDKFTKNRDTFVEMTGKVYDQDMSEVKDHDLSQAIKVSTALDELYKPKGQEFAVTEQVKVRTNVDTRHIRQAIAMDEATYKYITENRSVVKFKTDNPDYQSLYDKEAKLEKSFQVAIEDIERQYAHRAIDSMTQKTPHLPLDGEFKPKFTLTEKEIWSDIHNMKHASRKAQTEEFVSLNADRPEKITAIEKKIADIRLDSHVSNVSGTLDNLAAALARRQKLILDFNLADVLDPINHTEEELDAALANLKAKLIDDFKANKLSLEPYKRTTVDKADSKVYERMRFYKNTVEMKEVGEQIHVPQPLLDLRSAVRELQSLQTAYKFTTMELEQLHSMVHAELDSSAIAATAIMEHAFGSNAMADVAEADIARELASNAEFDFLRAAMGGELRKFVDEFDPETGEPTEAYQVAIAAHAEAAKVRLATIGLETGEASASGFNCLIHAALDQLSIRGDSNIEIAAEIRAALIARLATTGVILDEHEFLASDGPHVLSLVDILNERYHEAKIALRIYTPLPGGDLHFSNQGAENGTDGQLKENVVCLMWVGHHYEPIKMRQQALFELPINQSSGSASPDIFFTPPQSPDRKGNDFVVGDPSFHVASTSAKRSDDISEITTDRDVESETVPSKTVPSEKKTTPLAEVPRVTKDEQHEKIKKIITNLSVQEKKGSPSFMKQLTRVGKRADSLIHGKSIRLSQTTRLDRLLSSDANALSDLIKNEVNHLFEKGLSQVDIATTIAQTNAFKNLQLENKIDVLAKAIVLDRNI